MAALTTQTVTIANGATTSDAVEGQFNAGYGLQMPSAFTGASITFLVSADGSTFQALYDSLGTTQISVAVAASRSYDLPVELMTWRAWKIVSASNEGGVRSLVVIGKRP
jgi:hypothetical protein